MKLKTYFVIFACLYAWLYMFPSPLDEVPGLDLLFKPYADALEALTLWTGKNLLGLADLEKVRLTGSGDGGYQYVLLLVKLILSFLISFGALYWLRDEKRYATFIFWTRTAVRWYLGLYMMIYGAAKMVPGGQFGPPSLFDLNLRYGDFSPMGLLWRFMGYSHAYAIFTGLAEVLAGTLLLFRRTAMLGALLTVAVMTHVFMLNICYDVPVKLFSFHLLLFAFGLLTPNLVNLWRFFILHQPAKPFQEPDRLNKRWMVIARHALRLLLVGAMIFTVLTMSLSGRSGKTDETALRGIYSVRDLDYQPGGAPPADSLLWDRVVIARNRMALFTEDSRREFYKFKPDSLLTQFTLTSGRDSTAQFVFNLKQDSTTLKIDGLWRGDTLRATLKRLDESKFQLTSRGFHWVSEYPFNR